MERRDFIRLCAAGISATSPPAFGDAAARARLYPKCMLLDAQGAPLRAARVPLQTNLVFNFPYTTTPCFLLNLGKPLRRHVTLRTTRNESYDWPGGAGPDAAIVAYSAICAHQLAYPTKEISFISFRAAAGAPNRHAEVIHCCAEHSQYDPAEGGRVVAGPAPQPLAAILLECDAQSGALSAVGTLGGELFEQFFAKYAFRLSMEHGNAYRRPAGGTAVVRELADYCRQQVRC